MPTYEYHCRDCENSFDVIKRFAEIDNVENCPKCLSSITYRTISRTYFYGASDWDTAGYNPGLGMYVKNKKHAEKVAKARGLTEVGNESPEKMLLSQEREQKELEDKTFDKAFERTEHELKREIGRSK